MIDARSTKRMVVERQFKNPSRKKLLVNPANSLHWSCKNLAGIPSMLFLQRHDGFTVHIGFAWSRETTNVSIVDLPVMVYS